MISGDLPPSSIVACFIMRAGEAEHLAAGRHRAGERHLGDDRMAGERGADIAIALHDVEEAVRQAGLGVDLGERQRGERGVLGRLEHHRVAHGERRRGLPAGALDRIVPRADADADAERLAARVGEGAAEIDDSRRCSWRPRRRRYSSASAAEAGSATSVSWIALPVSSVSSRASSALRARRISAARRRMRPRSTGFSRAQAGCASRAASMASSTISRSRNAASRSSRRSPDR